MKRVFITMFIYLLTGCYYAESQTISSVDNLTDILQELGMDDTGDSVFEEWYDKLSLLISNPLDINKAGQEELEQISFLSDEQIQEIILYRQRYGDMVSIYELKNLEKLDHSTIRLLLPFIYIDENPVENSGITVNKLLKYGRNELVMRYNRSFQQKKGYQPPEEKDADDPNKRYLGEPFYHSIRYSYSYDTRVQAGVIAEKDAGEPFLKSNYKGYDYYSGHVVIKDINRLKTAVIGDYKASFGQGLVMSQDFTPGRTAMVTQADRRSNGFRRHFSTNEYDYLRGAAATLSVSGIDISLFYSSRKMDGIMDSIYIRSIKKDGIHRTVREQERKHVFTLTAYGANVRYSNHQLVVGITGVVTSFGKNELLPEVKPYNLYYLRGNKNSNLSVDYLWKKRTFKLFGETAISQNGSLATLHGIQLTPVSYIHLVALYRYYDKKYQSFHAKAFSHQSQVQNEEGGYIGISLTPLPFWKISAYADVFRFPWLRYGVDAPSRGEEYMIQVDHTLNAITSFYIRYRYSEKDKNYSVNSTRTIQPYSQEKIQCQVRVEPDEWFFRTSAEYGRYLFEDIKYKGFMLSQAVGWKPKDLPIRIDLYGGWFHTDDYAVRFRSFEKTLLYDFYSPTLFGKGFRLSAVIQCNFTQRVSATLKIAHTQYADREKIGTGLEEIEGNKKGDVYFQIRWKF